jgi:hypothetical protein
MANIILNPTIEANLNMEEIKKSQHGSHQYKQLINAWNYDTYLLMQTIHINKPHHPLTCIYLSTSAIPYNPLKFIRDTHSNAATNF